MTVQIHEGILVHENMILGISMPPGSGIQSAPDFILNVCP
jgi:hypothetical protein